MPMKIAPPKPPLPALLSTLAALFAGCGSTPTTDRPTPGLGAAGTTAGSTVEPSQDERMDWWRSARFGMFVHWGLYAIPAGAWQGKTDYGEWIRDSAQIPLEVYERFQSQWNPTAFDADAWARMAKQAGMKYVVITSKHHDGFCLYDSRFTDWDIGRTPHGQDILQQLAAACERHGLRFCTYHSIMDWHHPDYLPRRPWEAAARSTDGADFRSYESYLHAQVTEIVQRYRPAVMWFDGEWENTWNHDRGLRLWSLCRALDPRLIVNNRVDVHRGGMGGFSQSGEAVGDFHTPEQEIPATGLRRPGLGVVHDDELALGLERRRRQLEVEPRTGAQPDRHRQQGRQLPAQHRPARRRHVPAGSGAAAAGDRQLDAAERRGDPRHDRERVRRAAVGSLHGAGRAAHDEVVPARVRTTGRRPARAARARQPDRARPRARRPGARDRGGPAAAGADWAPPVLQLPAGPLDPIATVVVVELDGAPVVYHEPRLLADSDQFVHGIAVQLDSGSAGTVVRFTIDGSDPDADAPTTDLPVQIEQSATLKAATFRGAQRVSKVVQRTFTKVHPLPATEGEPHGARAARRALPRRLATRAQRARATAPGVDVDGVRGRAA